MPSILPPTTDTQPEPAPYYADSSVTVHHGDCLEILRRLPDASVDAVVTDPPYGLEFMGKDWDAPWQESDINADAGFKSGGMAVTSGLPSFTGSTNPKCLTCKGTRRGRRDGTAVRAVCICADGGRFPNFRAVEMRAFGEWCEAWSRECLRVLRPGGHLLAFGGTRTFHRLACAVEDAGFEVRDSIAWLYGSGFPKSRNLDGEWQGWGTALKPAFEPIVVARTPLIGTVAANVLAHGTGALNVDGCRIEGRERTNYGLQTATRTKGAAYGTPTLSADFDSTSGRWPANVILDESQAANLDEQRFFYTAKADASERPRIDGIAHPTVKPIALMRWLVRLVTPPGGTILEPFAGSGTTVEACILEGFRCIAVEGDGDYLPLILQRIHRRRDPVAAVKAAGDDAGLFDLFGEASA